MQISENLPQFENENAFLVVASAHHALVYLASGGEVKQIYENKVETPEYSDNEGMFKTSAAPGAYGSVLESKKDEAIKEVSKELSETLLKETENNKVDKIFLFVGPQLKGVLENDLNENIKKFIKMTFDGNYTNEEPTKLIEMISEKTKDSNHSEATGEAAEILDKTDHI